MATYLPHQPSLPIPAPSPGPRFRLAFRVVSDGLETARAQTLNAGRAAFPLFAGLPPELRLKIWEYLVAPRVVAAACLDAEAPPPDEEPEEPWAAFPELESPAPDPVPVLLRVSRETRALALARYAPAFAWKTPHVMLSSLPQRQQGTSAGTTTTATATATWSRPSVWFNYGLDALYLLGQLEPCDSYGFNSPMAYFLDREEARRVRRLAVAFAALKYGEMAPQDIFGALFHCVDRFARAVDEDGRVLVAVTPRDEYTNALMGGEQPLVRDGGGDEAESKVQKKDEVNIVQKTWRDWYRGSIVTSSLANVQFELVREEDLPQHIANSGKANQHQS
ncbi:hypothetical protein F4818DRAFT_395824 [Hypoxylon cercidicola]|nr:hypothetical protein F4818DRAFT_395824 [Hypoxylon cercidicola]